MNKAFLIPEHEVEYLVEVIQIGIERDMAVVNIGTRDVGDAGGFSIQNVSIKISDITSDALAKGQITQANINGFEKIWKLLAMRAIKKELTDY